MRELKFRAWDKKSKKIRIVESIGFGELSYYNEGYPVANMIGRDCIHDKDIIIHRDSYQHELMQYTGLKDKNGKEIYEGDIIQCNNLLWCVNYDMGSYTIGFTLDGINHNESCVHHLVWEDGKVIGNIYENPKLLEGN